MKKREGCFAGGVFCAAMLVSQLVMANNLHSGSASFSSFAYLDGSLGLAFQIKPLHHLTYLATVPGYPDDALHYNYKDGNLYATLGGGYGWQWRRTWFPRIDIGLSMQHGSVIFGGLVDEYGFSSAQNYKFYYRMSSSAFLAQLTFDVVKFSRYSLFAFGGAGPAYVRTYDYSETALVSPARNSLAFGDNAKWNLGYELGAGVRMALSPRWDVTLRYEYNDMGKAHLGTGPVRPGVEGPGTRLVNNIVLLGLSAKI